MNLIMPPEIINEARYAFELFENAQLFRQCACNEWMYVGGDVKNSYLRRVWFCEYWWSMNLPTYYIPAYQGAYRFVCTHTQTFKVTIQWCIQQYTYVYIQICMKTLSVYVYICTQATGLLVCRASRQQIPTPPQRNLVQPAGLKGWHKLEGDITTWEPGWCDLFFHTAGVL